MQNIVAAIMKESESEGPGYCDMIVLLKEGSCLGPLALAEMEKWIHFIYGQTSVARKQGTGNQIP